MYLDAIFWFNCPVLVSVSSPALFSVCRVSGANHVKTDKTLTNQIIFLYFTNHAITMHQSFQFQAYWKFNRGTKLWSL